MDEQLHITEVPQSIRSHLGSDAVINLIDQINRKFNFSDQQVAVVPTVIRALILHSIAANQFTDKVAEELGVTQERAEIIAHEVRDRILKPVKKDLKDFGVDIDLIQVENIEREHRVRNVPTRKPQRTHLIKEVVRPAFSQDVPTPPNTTQGPASSNPFVIHEHESPQEGQQTSGYEGGLVKPSFYKTPSGTADTQTGDVPRAHLEIGTEEEAQQQPKTAKVGKEQANVVHYTTPKTPGDPFATKPKTPNKDDVSPNNVVNLKDLPQ